MRNNKNLFGHIFKHFNNQSSIIRGICIWAIFQLVDENIKNKLKKQILSFEKNKYVLYELKMAS